MEFRSARHPTVVPGPRAVTPLSAFFAIFGYSICAGPGAAQRLAAFLAPDFRQVQKELDGSTGGIIGLSLVARRCGARSRVRNRADLCVSRQPRKEDFLVAQSRSPRFFRIPSLIAFVVFLMTSGAELGAQTEPNSWETYRTLREAVPVAGHQVENIVLRRDAAELRLTRGTVTFLPPVLDRVVCGVFNGEGEFMLQPEQPQEIDYLKRLLGEERVTDRFEQAVFWFLDGTYKEITGASAAGPPDSRSLGILEDLRKRLRRRTEEPRSLLESLIAGDEVENLEAEVLMDFLNGTDGFFDAYLFGKRFSDLRLRIRPRGALTQLPAWERVSLIHFKPKDRTEGILYLGEGSAIPDRPPLSEQRQIDVTHYRVDTTFDGGNLKATADLDFATVSPVKMLKVNLLPTLRVSRVSLAGMEEDLSFIQEGREEDGGLYVIFPELLPAGTQGRLSFAYAGDKVIKDAGGGNWAVGARSSWYPNVNAFADRATFDLTFRIPKKLELVSVGRKVGEQVEGKHKVSRWVSDIPLGIAGFNCGLYKQKSVVDNDTGYQIEGYAVRKLPDYLYGAQEIGGMSPTRLLDNAIVDAQNSIRVYTHWFGPSPYGRIAITQQPEFSFGQSWPGLVYLPIIAFFDSTQRWRLLDGLTPDVSDFVEEVVAHEVAHQWWGHLVGWASFHDQWLSEGFADFSSSLFLEVTADRQRVERFWEESRKRILEKDRTGRSANDCGPLWQGLRLSTAENPSAYAKLVYRKGAFVIHMLRRMMWDPQTGDQRFRAMMQDFFNSHLHELATTESFQALVEEHMTPEMDMGGNGRMDWFFRQWVYGTEVPSYELAYSLQPQDGGNFLLTAVLSQSGVSDDFRMVVPMYVDFGGNMVLLGHARLVGSSSTPEFQVPLPSRPSRILVNALNDVLALESQSRER